MTQSPAARQVFRLFLIKPSHYDDDGYVIQRARSSIPANTLAALYGLALDCAQRRVLGEGVELRITVWDETNTPSSPQKSSRRSGRPGVTGWSVWSAFRPTSSRGRSILRGRCGRRASRSASGGPT